MFDGQTGVSTYWTQTGQAGQGLPDRDMVKAVVTKGVHIGVYVGRVAVRATGSFNITTNQGKTVQGISHRSCTALHTGDGYSYGKGDPTSQAPRKERLFPPHV